MLSSLRIKFITLLLFTTIVYTQPGELISLNGPMGGTVGDVEINSKGHIYAGVYLAHSGLYRSTDNGESWEKIETPDPIIAVYGIYINEEDDIYVGTNFGGRIWRSTDEGASWENIREGYDTGECWAFGESTDGVLFAGDGQYGGAYRSTNNGAQWEYMAHLGPLTFCTDTVNNIVYAGSQIGLFATSDNGLNWAKSNFFENIAVSSILMDEEGGIYCGTGYYPYDSSDGLYYSSDDGASWEKVGLDNKIVLSLAFNSEGVLYAGTNSNGLYWTSDRGQTWNHSDEGLYRKQLYRMDINKDDEIFIGSEQEGIFRSTDKGISFEHIGLPISRVDDVVYDEEGNLYTATPSGIQKYELSTGRWRNLGFHNVTALDKAPNGEMYAATYADGIWYTEDNGENWIDISPGPDTLKTIFNVKVVGQDTLLGAFVGKIYKTINNGDTWEKIDIGLRYVSSAIEVTDDGEIYLNEREEGYRVYKGSKKDFIFEQIYYYPEFGVVGKKGRLKLNSKKDIYLCTYKVGDGLWKINSNTGDTTRVIDIPLNTVFVNKEDKVFTGGDRGGNIYWSKDDGKTWEVLTNFGDQEAVVTYLGEDKEGNLLVGNWKQGLFKVDKLTSTENKEDLPTEFVLHQNYPNPFNPTTSIEYQLSSSEKVNLKVYDILGREISALVNEVKAPGSYEVQFDASQFSSGVYFYRLTAGEFVQTKKMLLIK